jgi:CheY-like chemotaxis protein
MRILVAEDDLDAAEMYKMVLEARGHVVLIASDGRRCLNLYKSAMADDSNGKTGINTPFDAVVLDHMMPFVTGLQAAREILSICPNQRIIIASAYLKDSLKDSLNFLSKVVEIMLKPFEPEMLADAIEDMSVVEKLQELNTSAYAENASIDKLLTELKAIQKPGTI